MRKLLILGAIAGLVAAFAPSAASGHTAPRSMTVTHYPSQPGTGAVLSFKVNSPLSKCRNGVGVKLFKDGVLFAGAQGKTDNTGRFTIRLPFGSFPSGHYEAVAALKKLAKKNGHRHKCARATKAIDL